MYTKVLKELLKVFHGLPENLVKKFLVDIHKLSPARANQTLFSACQQRKVIKKEDYILYNRNISIDDNIINNAKAFAVLLRLKENLSQHYTDLECNIGSSPFSLYGFLKSYENPHKNMLLKVSILPKNSEYAFLELLKMRTENSEKFNFMKYILILSEKDFPLEYITVQSISLIYYVDKNFDVFLLEKRTAKKGI